MSVPGQSSELPVGVSPTGVAASRRLRTEPCTSEATKGVMRGRGRNQAVTRVNVLSPEIANIAETGLCMAREADLLHLQGRPQGRCREGETARTLPGSETTAWSHMVNQGTLGEPGGHPS